MIAQADMTAAIPIEVILAAVGGLVVALGIPKILDRLVVHREKQQDSAMAMLRVVIEAQVAQGSEQTAAIVELGGAVRELAAKSEAQATLLQGLEIRTIGTGNGGQDTAPIGD